MIEAKPNIEFIIGEEKRLNEIVSKVEIEPLLRSALKLGIARAALLDEDDLPLALLGKLPEGGAPVRRQLNIMVEGEPKGALLLEATCELPGFEAIARLLQDALQLTVTNNLKRMLTTEVHTSIVQESYEQLVNTNRRLMESERRYRDLARDLELKVEQRTAELKVAYSRLLQQEKLAAVGQLAAGMAHEINTPLGFIGSNLHSFTKYQARMTEMLELYQRLLEEGGALEQIRQQTGQRRQQLKLDFVLADSTLLLEQCREGVERITTIVAQLKGFAHLDGMGQQRMDLVHELEQLLAGLAPQFPPSTKLITDLQPLPPVVCRVPLLVQAFANILDNALKSRAEGLELRVSSAVAGQRLQIIISDNGCGIPADQLDRIFEPFFTTRPVGSGTGMGLTVAREAIVSAGGAIEVTSCVGKGTVVTVCLPLTLDPWSLFSMSYAHLFKPAASAARKGTEEPLELEAPVPRQEPFTLLFVDDEEGVLGALKRIFMDENYTILTAVSADKALKIMEERPVHLLVSDHRMPGMTGAELLKVVRERWPETIRIMLTGYADVNSIMGAVKEGAVYKFITKPWNDEDLRLTVSLALQQYVLMHENRSLKELARQQQTKLKNYAGLFEENRGMLGDILLKAGLIGQEELGLARKQQEPGEFLGDALVRLKLVSEAHLLAALQKALGVEYLDLRELTIPVNVTRCLPRELCEKQRLIPVKLDGSQLTIAMADPSDILTSDNIAMVTGLKVTAVLAPSFQISERLRQAWENGESMLDEFSELEPLDEIDIVLDDDEKEASVEELIGSSKVPPVIRIVNAIISEAIRYGASDIHLEAKTKNSVIRYRIDGMLHAKIRIPADLHAAVVSRLKILARMDIAERRRPQDGRITVKAGTRIVDLRVSSLPTINGEKIVMRILDKSSAIKRLDELGVLADDLDKITVISRKPQGVIIATGPTGSGKTTMLYSLLAAMMNPSKNFETIEEPVEYFLEEANQVAIHEKIGLSFAQVLRATLRQDPDVILVGEVRDFETADTAFKAALTGHMVLTTLHTNSAVASITRLIDMGVKPYILASALEGIIAQRLVRRICENCRQEVVPDKEQLRLLRVPEGFFGGRVQQGGGCARCNNTGYKGRLGIYEIFLMSDDYRQMIGTSYKESEILAAARVDGMRSLLEDGLEKVRQGLTTMDEILRVVGPAVRMERHCDHCGKLMESRHLFCPHCGAFRQNCCRSCHRPLEDDWLICPECGTKR